MGSMVDLVNSITIGAGLLPLSVPYTFTLPGESIVTGKTGLWTDPLVVEMPEGAGFPRREESHLLTVLVSDMPSAPKGTVVVAAEVPEGSDKTWRVESSIPSKQLGKRILILLET